MVMITHLIAIQSKRLGDRIGLSNTASKPAACRLGGQRIATSGFGRWWRFLNNFRHSTKCNIKYSQRVRKAMTIISRRFFQLTKLVVTRFVGRHSCKVPVRGIRNAAISLQTPVWFAVIRASGSLPKRHDSVTPNACWNNELTRFVVNRRILSSGF